MESRKSISKDCLEDGMICTVVHQTADGTTIETTGRVNCVSRDPEFFRVIGGFWLDLPDGSSPWIKGHDIRRIFVPTDCPDIPPPKSGGTWRIAEI